MTTSDQFPDPNSDSEADVSRPAVVPGDRPAVGHQDRPATVESPPVSVFDRLAAEPEFASVGRMMADAEESTSRHS